MIVMMMRMTMMMMMILLLGKEWTEYLTFHMIYRDQVKSRVYYITHIIKKEIM